MELFEIEFNGTISWGVRGNGIYQEVSPDGQPMTHEQALSFMTEVQERIAQG
jgi:hypothetical protein